MFEIFLLAIIVIIFFEWYWIVLGILVGLPILFLLGALTVYILTLLTRTTSVLPEGRFLGDKICIWMFDCQIYYWWTGAKWETKDHDAVSLKTTSLLPNNKVYKWRRA